MNTRLFNTKSLLIFILFCLTLAGGLNAQGFVRHYPFFTWTDGGAQSVFPQADGSFRLTATSYPDFGVDISLLWLETDAQGQLVNGDTLTSPLDTGPVLFLLENGDHLKAVSDSNQVTVQHILAAGNTAWSQTFDFPGFDAAYIMALRPNAAGEVFGRGNMWFAPNGVAVDSGFVFKLSADGNLLWKTIHALGVTSVVPSSLEPTPDGGCVFANFYHDGFNSIGAEVLRFAVDGTPLWNYYAQYGSTFPYSLDNGLAVNANGETLVPVRPFVNPAGVDSLILEKVSASGQLLDQTNVQAALGVPNLEAKLSFPTADGGWVVVAQHYLLNSWVQYLLRINAAGDVVWYKPLTCIVDAFPADFADGQELPDGSLVLYGQQGELFLIKLGADGTIYPHTVVGQVVRDSTFDCLVSPNDPPLSGWIVTATGNGLTHFAATNATGHYAIPDLDTGDYVIKVVPPNYLWNVCVDSVALNLPGSLPQIDTVDFPIQPLYDCPLMQVDLGLALLRRCFPNTYFVNYCNAGNQSADPVTVTVQLDPLLQVDSASIPHTQAGDLVIFELGTVQPGECGSFQLYVTLSCDAELGQTLCAEAHIFPDTICAPNLPNWSGAAIEVSAACVGDSVEFSIRNVGIAPTSGALDFIVVDDHVITRQGLFNLPAGAVKIETVPADGSTWRLSAEQEPGFPFGEQMPSVAVEGCNPAGGGFSIGMLNMFPNYSGDPFHDIECRTVIGSYDPNDKLAFPLGVDAPHFIEQNQPLEYLIRFQNTGTDTAFTVVVRDTLSPWLDPATVRPGAASHPYTWTLGGNGILTFVFDDILLPDSNVNELASHGFVQFNIDQQKDVPLGTLLENHAGIFFDFNAVVLTNTVFHTVGHNFLPVVSVKEPVWLSTLNVWPNPAGEVASVWSDRPFVTGQRLVLRDAMGRVVQNIPVQGQMVELRRAGLPAGLYFLELRDGGRVLCAGKVIWQL